MANIQISGLEDFEKRLLNMEDKATAAVPAMLKAGAEVLVNAEKDEMKALNLVDTGDMMKSVKPTKIRKKGSESYIEVYPQGKDRKGVSNTTKAFVAQYGKSNSPARPWLTAARQKSEGSINEAMGEAWKNQK